MKIEKLDKLVATLDFRAKQAERASNVSVIVGYTQAYAIFVHENLQAKHPVGQAKFLEQPARQNAKRYGEIAGQLLKKGKTMAQSLLVAGLALQRDSQQLVPVDTGALRNSAFTRLEKGSE